jgi:STE24 endopeptidase
MADLDFSHEDVERASRYHRPLYFVLAARVLLGVAVYSLLTWGWIAGALRDGLGGLGWAGSAAAWAGAVATLAAAARLPLAAWSELAHERRWGFSRETARSWAVDRAKGLAIALLLTAAVWVAAVGLARALPSWWWLPAAGALALLTVFLSFIAPVVLEPLFNRFEPLADERLAASLRTLSAAAGVPVRDVLVSDASRRTTKTNAYVSGLGATRRVVLWDTLLAANDEREVQLVVAHELGHRRERHAAKLTALVVAGGAVGVAVLRAVLGAPQPQDLPSAVLLFTALELAGLPVVSAISRSFERVADRWSLELTHDLDAFERAHLRLARDNLSDLAPPRLAYLLLFTHPTPPERLAFGRRLAAG